MWVYTLLKCFSIADNVPVIAGVVGNVRRSNDMYEGKNDEHGGKDGLSVYRYFYPTRKWIGFTNSTGQWCLWPWYCFCFITDRLQIYPERAWIVAQYLATSMNQIRCMFVTAPNGKHVHCKGQSMFHRIRSVVNRCTYRAHRDTHPPLIPLLCQSPFQVI